MEKYNNYSIFFNSDTFKIRITQPFLEKLKSSKVKGKDDYWTFVNIIKRFTKYPIPKPQFLLKGWISSVDSVEKSS